MKKFYIVNKIRRVIPSSFCVQMVDLFLGLNYVVNSVFNLLLWNMIFFIIIIIKSIEWIIGWREHALFSYAVYDKRIEGRVEKKNYYLENGRFMNIGKVMNSVKRMEIKRTRGRFERRRQREYENSLMFSNNNQIMKFKRSFVTNYLNKKVNRVKNEMSNIYIDHSCEKIIIEHVLISDFVKLENKEVALVMYCMTSKKRDIALKSKERETMARIVNTGSNEESQGFCEIPYGVVVSSKELANFWLNRMDFLSKKKISEREICSNVKKLEMEVSDRSEVFIVNRGENKWQSFETENFNYNKLQSLNDLMIKVEELFKK